MDYVMIVEGALLLVAVGVAGRHTLQLRREAREVEMAKHSKLPKIVLRVSEETKELFATAARDQGLTLDAWVVSAAMLSIQTLPVPVPEKPEDGLDAAFRALDQEEAEGGGDLPSNVLPLPPRHVPKPEPVAETGSMVSPELVVAAHPCVHLAGEFPSNFGPGECQGICRSPKQDGRVCFFAAPAARHCDCFRHKRGSASAKTA